MVSVYPAGSTIGALLRKIEEERKTAPHVKAPGKEPAEPMRKSVAAPLESPIAPESPGTSRVVSVRPSIAPAGSEAQPTTIAPTSAKMGQIGGPGLQVVPGVAPAPPEPQPAAPGAAPATAGDGEPRVVSPVAPRPPASIATRVAPSGDSFSRYFGPSAGPAVREFTEGTYQPSPQPSPMPSPRTNFGDVLAWSQSGAASKAQQAQKAAQQKRVSPPSSKYEKKKEPSASERLASYLQPFTNWFGRWF